MELGLKGKRAIVLAASRGLGYASALGLAREGCDLVICSRDQEHIEAAADNIRRETRARVYPLAVNVAEQAGIDAVVRACVEQYGGVEIAVHNAGGPPTGDFVSITEPQWRKAFDQNLMSLVWLSQAVIPEMKRAGYGRIIAIASSSVKQPIPNLLLSNTLRTGVVGLIKTMSKELGQHNILCNVVAPGRIATERIHELDTDAAQRSGKSVEDVRRGAVATIPLGRLGNPEELGNAVVFLASQAASYISGHVLLVDGAKTDALQ